uniref:Uncharacterized protein n=1 Tax=Gossypium raimondii TaxID=29730 RepID=A0A0D2RMY8_GOSRA|nr:hypothetical protein B456_008G266800 [Gossypium raimondii]
MKLKKKDATHGNEIQIIMRDSFLLFSFIKTETKTKKRIDPSSISPNCMRKLRVRGTYICYGIPIYIELRIQK